MPAIVVNARETTVETKSGGIAMCDHGGAGPAVLLVHGTGHNRAVWEPVVERLREDFRLVTFDLRGHGQSEANSADAEDHWRDLGMIVDRLGLERPIIVGHSGGGYATTAHAASGGPCGALVVVDGFVLDMREEALKATGVLPREQWWELFRYGWLATTDERDAWVRQVVAQAPADWLNAGIDPQLVESFTCRSFVSENGRWRRRPTMEEIECLTRLDPQRRILPAREVYDLVQVPTSFVFARHGLYRDRRAEVEGLAEKNAARFVEIDAGHNIHIQRPQELAGVIREVGTALV